MNEQYCFWMVFDEDDGKIVSTKKIKSFSEAKRGAVQTSKDNPGKAYVVLQSVCHFVDEGPVLFNHIEPEQELPF